VSDPGTDLGTLGGAVSSGGSINASGQVVGYSRLAGDVVQHAFRTTATGKVSDPGTDLGTLGGDNSGAGSINASGQVTGSSEITPGSSTHHAFRTTATGKVSDPGTDLGTLGGTNSGGGGINSFGVLVGSSEIQVGSLTEHAFIYDTQMRDLNNLIPSNSGWVLNAADAINDAGWITGYGTIGGNAHAFLLTPVPEPGSLALLGLPAAVWAVGRRLRRRSSFKSRVGLPGEGFGQVGPR
jgi:probable HAF family extracellular repeat protein